MKPPTKVCRTCGVTKPIEGNFNARKQCKDGFRPTCKDCDRHARRVYEGKEPPPGAPAAPLATTEKVIGHIGVASGGGPRVREVAIDPIEDVEKAAAAEYAALLNRKLSVRTRANLMVKIAKNVQGFNAALALKALADINLATGVTSRSGIKVELGPMFMLPENSDVKMSG